MDGKSLKDHVLTGSISRYYYYSSSVCVHVPKKLSLDGLQLASEVEHALTTEWCGMVLRVVGWTHRERDPLVRIPAAGAGLVHGQYRQSWRCFVVSTK